MIRASVPEAAVNENRESLTWEGYVDGPSPVPRDLEDDPESAAASMELAAKRNLRGRVATPRRRHPLRDDCGRCPGVCGQDGSRSFDHDMPPFQVVSLAGYWPCSSTWRADDIDWQSPRRYDGQILPNRDCRQGHEMVKRLMAVVDLANCDPWPSAASVR